jgi:hypothetical protein
LKQGAEHTYDVNLVQKFGCSPNPVGKLSEGLFQVFSSAANSILKSVFVQNFSPPASKLVGFFVHYCILMVFAELVFPPFLAELMTT